MPHSLHPWNKKLKATAFYKIYRPAQNILPSMPELKARGDRPLQMEFEHQLKALILFHLEEHTSAQHLLQVLEEDAFASTEIAPPEGIKKSSFSEAINTRGLEQFFYMFEQLQKQATKTIPAQHSSLGDLVAIDGSLIDAVLSMHWADYRKGSKKAKAHIGFDINRSIPKKIFLTDGKGDERSFVGRILSPGQTGIMDRGYQCHADFDRLQEENKSFVCRIKASTHKTCLKSHPVDPESIVFYDATVLLGTPGVNQTQKQLRLVAYRVEGIDYWIATNRFDLKAEQIAQIYKLRWDIEKFFAWWKRHLKVYHLIARSPYGLMVQLLAGLITYLLLAIYCHENYNEKVSIKRVRELRIMIQNEARDLQNTASEKFDFKEQKNLYSYAKT
jgi:hypothetical protein